MGIVRKDITSADLEGLYARLDRMLDKVGIETQPKIAARLVELASDPDAQIKDYHSAIKTDWALTGRVLRLANSAFYAQRAPVTRLERALIVLGIERIKAVSLGFYLSRAAGAESARGVARKVWSQSVYRASLCTAMARSQCPHLVPEAFIVGLMLDCGQPLMAKLLGPAYEKVLEEHPSPVKLYAFEHEHLEFTHQDVVTVLARRWKLPALLARPIAWHHTMPSTGRSIDPATLMHRVAYYVGSLQLNTATGLPTHRTPMSTVAQRLFEMGSTDLETIVMSAGREYASTAGLFGEFVDGIEDVDTLSDAVQAQLIEIMDEQMQRNVQTESRGGPEKLMISGMHVEVEPGRNGEVIAYINTSCGERLVSCTVNPSKETPESVGQMLGLEDASTGDLLDLIRIMQSLAA